MKCLRIFSPFRRFHQERAVLLPILAVLFLSLFAFVVFIGIEPHLVRTQKAEILERLDILCQDVAKKAYDPDAAVALFQLGMNSMHGDGLFKKLLNPAARLVLPTFEDFATPSLSCAGGVDCTLLTDLASLDTGAFPTYFFDTGDPIAAGATIPVTRQEFLNGTLALCDFTADWQTSGIFQGLRSAFSNAVLAPNIRLRVGHVNRVSNWYAQDMNSEPAWERTDEIEKLEHSMPTSSNPISDYWDNYYNRVYTRGLSIVIAPHMTTSLGVDRFLMDGGVVHDDYNPQRDLVTGGFGFIAPHLQGIAANIDFGPSVNLQPLPALQGNWIGSERDQMLQACMNPAILLRNTFVASLLELASRHGQLRTRTGVHVAGTQHQLLAALGDGAMTVPTPIPIDPPSFAIPATTDLAPRIPNAPVPIVDIGTDITVRDSQHPFVFYFNGARDLPPDFGFPNPENQFRRAFPWPVFGSIEPGVTSPFVATAGYISPIAVADHPPATGDSGWDDSLATYRSLISNQLRICAHLYRPGRASLLFDQSIGLDLPVGGDYNRINTLPANSTNSLAHECQFVNGTNVRITRFCGGNGMIPANAVRTLGSVQICPVEMWGGSFPLLPNDYVPGQVCTKPINPQDDLKPDLLAALLSLDPSTAIFDTSWPTSSGDRIDVPHTLAVTPTFAAPYSPGAFAIASQFPAPLVPGVLEASRTLLPFPTPNAYHEATRPPRPNLQGEAVINFPRINTALTSIVLIVTHKGINAAERDLLASKIYELNTLYSPDPPWSPSPPRLLRRAPRPVVIVFIPTDDQAAQTAGFYQQALGLTSDTRWGLGYNTFIELSPRSPAFDTANPDFDYISLWTALLSVEGTPETDQQNIIDIAYTVFENAILKPDRIW